MIKNIVKGKQIFSKKATPATEADRQVITDLLDTLRANREICVGMAANMIGVNKAIIVVAAGPFQFSGLVSEFPDYWSSDLCNFHIICADGSVCNELHAVSGT